MPFFILFAVLFAKFKGYKTSYLFKTWTIYPIIVAEIIQIFFQITTIFGMYGFMKYVSAFKVIHLMLFLIPFLVFKLYKAGLIGSVSIVIGSLMNKFVIYQNGGKMPVYPTLSLLTGNVRPDSFERIESIYILGTESSRWKIFSDFIDLGYAILSIGDLFVHFFAFIIIFYTIKALNEKYEINKK